MTSVPPARYWSRSTPWQNNGAPGRAPAWWRRWILSTSSCAIRRPPVRVRRPASFEASSALDDGPNRSLREEDQVAPDPRYCLQSPADPASACPPPAGGRGRPPRTTSRDESRDLRHLVVVDVLRPRPLPGGSPGVAGGEEHHGDAEAGVHVVIAPAVGVGRMTIGVPLVVEGEPCFPSVFTLARPRHPTRSTGGGSRSRGGNRARRPARSPAPPRPTMSMLSSATIESRGTVGCRVNQSEPSSPISSAVCQTNRIERVGRLGDARRPRRSRAGSPSRYRRHRRR